MPEDMNENEKIPLLNRIPLTRIKLIIARILYFLVKLVIHDNQRIISRNHIQYKVDLSEGIDFSLFLFANFQRYVIHSKLFKLRNDAIIFDVGANIGSMTLQFAQIAPEGHVYAFEPTRYAFEKLEKNLSLNPTLSNHITSIRAFVSDECTDRSRMQAYSSWKIDGSGEETHPLHGGTLKSNAQEEIVPAFTIDAFCQEHHINRVDFIKIDTDGHELKVLKGAAQTMQNFQPVIIFEAGLSIIREQNVCFDDYYELLTRCGYVLYNGKNNKIVNMENYTRHIPLNYTTDIIAIPS